MDCFGRELAYEKIRRQLRKEDCMGAGVVDIALWDLAGPRLHASVTQPLGGIRRRLKAYASTGFGGGDGGGLATPEAYHSRRNLKPSAVLAGWILLTTHRKMPAADAYHGPEAVPHRCCCVRAARKEPLLP